MRLLITGAGGMLAGAVGRAAAAAGWDVTMPARAELDVTDAGAVRSALERARPDAVINCAAFTDVDAAESAREAALAINADGARNVAAAAAAVEAIAVYPSTDYVFDGAKREPYVESDPTAPRSVYGESKLAGERETAAANPRHAIARTSWLFGSDGTNFVRTMLKLAAERDSVRVVSDQIGCPTYTGHLADALLSLATNGRTGTFHLAASGHCSWHDFATEIFRQAGVECEAVPCTTDEFPRPAPRPAWSVLGSEVADAPALPPWQEGLAAYLTEGT